jgi:hypothetical protein
VWYTKGIYVSFVNCFVVILPHHKNVLLLWFFYSFVSGVRSLMIGKISV